MDQFHLDGGKERCCDSLSKQLPVAPTEGRTPFVVQDNQLGRLKATTRNRSRSWSARLNPQAAARRPTRRGEWLRTVSLPRHRAVLPASVGGKTLTRRGSIIRVMPAKHRPNDGDPSSCDVVRVCLRLLSSARVQSSNTRDAGGPSGLRAREVEGPHLPSIEPSGGGGGRRYLAQVTRCQGEAGDADNPIDGFERLQVAAGVHNAGSSHHRTEAGHAEQDRAVGLARESLSWTSKSASGKRPQCRETLLREIPRFRCQREHRVLRRHSVKVRADCGDLVCQVGLPNDG